MKTDIFSFNRLGLLFRRYFAERSHTELIYWSIMVIAFMFIRNIPQLMIGLIIIAGAFYAARFFKEIHFPNNGVAYFMIPATQLEKLTVGIVMTSFYYFAMMMVIYIIGNLLGTFLNNILVNVGTITGFNIFHHSSLRWELFSAFMKPWKSGYANLVTYLFEMFLVVQSIYLFGSIYFKRNHFFATFLATNIIQILLSIVFIIELRLIPGDINYTPSYYDWGRTVASILKNVFWLIPLFFWIVSYFRLTEKQV